MAKNVFIYTDDEKKLYNMLQQQVKKANARISKLEKLDIKDSFVLKELRDKLSAKEINALTKSGNISMKGGYNLSQLLAIQKATDEFLSGVSTLREISNLKKSYEQKLGKALDLKKVNTLYQAQSIAKWEWLVGCLGSKETWIELYPSAKEMSADNWIESVTQRLEAVKEEYLQEDIEALYLYFNK